MFTTCSGSILRQTLLRPWWLQASCQSPLLSPIKHPKTTNINRLPHRWPASLYRIPTALCHSFCVNLQQDICSTKAICIDLFTLLVMHHFKVNKYIFFLIFVILFSTNRSAAQVGYTKGAERAARRDERRENKQYKKRHQKKEKRLYKRAVKREQKEEEAEDKRRNDRIIKYKSERHRAPRTPPTEY